MNILSTSVGTTSDQGALAKLRESGENLAQSANNPEAPTHHNPPHTLTPPAPSQPTSEDSLPIDNEDSSSKSIHIEA